MRAWQLVAIGLALSFVGCRPRAPEIRVEQPPASLALDVEPGSVRLEPGLATTVKVGITRNNFNDAIRIELVNLPAGLTATSITTAANDTSADIELTAAPTLTPGEKPGVQASGGAGELQTKSKPFTISVIKPTISYTFEPTHLKIPKGETRQLKVTLERGREAFQGPVEVSLANLPKNVTATQKSASKDGDTAVFALQAGAAAPAGESQPLVRVIGAKQARGVGVFALTVLGEPFALKVEPTRLDAVFGQSTKLKVTAVRKDYQGPISLRLEGLPGNIKVKPVTIAAKQTSGEIELAVPGAALSTQAKLQLRGNADDGRHASVPVELKVEGRPFTLQMQPPRLDIVQGSSAKLKVTAVRAKDFTGSIALEIRNLPKSLKTQTLGIPLEGNSGEIDVNADDAAALGNLPGLELVGSALVGSTTREVKANLALAVQPPFSLAMQPAKIELVEGQKTTVKVNAIRRTYKGTIALTLKNLPAGVTASEAEIARDQNSADIEITAGPGSSGKIKPDVHALGTAASKKQVASNNATVLVLSKLFELKVDKAVKLSFGGKTFVRVSAKRLDYDGPIAIEAKNLPEKVKAEKAVIAKGQTEIDVEISAQDDAKETTAKAHLLGTATAFGNQQRPSDDFAVQVVPGLFDLKIDPPLVKLHHGSTVKVTVIAQRKGHDGPIPIELKNLPAMMKADKATIAKGENRVEIEIKAAATVTEGAKVDVFARGAAGAKNVDSPRFVVNVVSFGQAPQLELKVAPASIKLVPGESVKVKVSAIRKGYTGPVSVDLRNLSADVESSKGMIAEGQNDVEITLTARAKAEPTIKSDVCAVGIATASENRVFASPAITLQVGRK